MHGYWSVSGPTIPRPDELRSKVLSPSTVWLEWKDPSLGRVQQLTDSRYYNVHYRPLMTPAAVSRNSTDTRGAGVAGRTLSVVVKATHVVFYDLRAGTRYEFKVRTVKDAVASAFSDTIVNKTYETGRFYCFVMCLHFWTSTLALPWIFVLGQRFDHYECGRLSWLGQLYGAL